MSNVKQLDDELNNMILTGKVMDGFEKFYAEDVTMQENTEPPAVGKEACRKREVDFFAAVEEFHSAKLLSSGVGEGGAAFGEWEYDITFKGTGRVTMNQVAVRRWKDGQIASERFYYSKG